MMKLNVSLMVKMKLRGKCPLHPRYNPNLGQGAIHGGCKHCQALYEATRAADKLYEAAARLEAVAQPFLIARAGRGCSKPASRGA